MLSEKREKRCWVRRGDCGCEAEGLLKLPGLPGGDPWPPVPHLEGAKLEEMRQLLTAFRIRERYRL